LRARRPHDQPVRAPIDRDHGLTGSDRAAPLSDVVGVGQRDSPVVDDTGRRAPQRPDPGRVRLDLADPLGPDDLEPGHPVRLGPRAQRVEPAELVVRHGDDELPAALERDRVTLAVRLELGLARTAQSGLERARRVVQAGVDDAAVVAGLVARRLGLLLDDLETETRPGLEQSEGGGQPDDPGADDDAVEPAVVSRAGDRRGLVDRHRSGRRRLGCYARDHARRQSPSGSARPLAAARKSASIVRAWPSASARPSSGAAWPRIAALRFSISARYGSPRPTGTSRSSRKVSLFPSAQAPSRRSVPVAPIASRLSWSASKPASIAANKPSPKSRSAPKRTSTAVGPRSWAACTRTGSRPASRRAPLTQ